jgi:hypothetical protein
MFDSPVATSLAAKRSRFGTVHLDDLRIDRQFQRTLNLNAVKKIKAEYHPAGLGPLLVARITGENGYCVVDGQTRLAAIRDLPDTNGSIFPAEIFDGQNSLDVSEAALLFRLRNNQKPIPPKERDRIATVEGDPIMTEVVRQVAATNYVIFDDDTDKITMPHVSEAKMIVRWGSDKKFPDLLARSLLIQAHAFEPADGSLDGTVDPKILAATADLLLRNENLNDDELVRIMSDVQLPALQAQIGRRADAEGIRFMSAAKSVLVERYNKGKKGDDRISRSS